MTKISNYTNFPATLPYQSYSNFYKFFVRPMVLELIKSKGSFASTDKSIRNIATNIGVGDDVSLGFIIKDKLNLRYYKNEL